MIDRHQLNDIVQEIMLAPDTDHTKAFEAASAFYSQLATQGFTMREILTVLGSLMSIVAGAAEIVLETQSQKETLQ